MFIYLFQIYYKAFFLNIFFTKNNIMDNLLNISAIDGRYNGLTKELAPYLSEYGFFKYRVKVEVLYYIFLNKTLNFVNLDYNNLMNIKTIMSNFTLDECMKVKEIEKKINHDVKSVEYYLVSKLKEIDALKNTTQFIHFGLTSQDINNTSITLMIKDSLNHVILPELNKIIYEIFNKTLEWIKIVMTSHTHGQPAVPTTLGKEFQVFHYRLKKQLKLLESTTYYGKFGGASGNLNAHYTAYSDIQWDKELAQFLGEIGLEREILTTQIDNYENLAVVFDCLRRINTIIVDMNRDIWHYISIEYLTQKFNKDEVGSTTMPQKINPINFENSEGNLLMANSMLDFMSNKLPVSRLQRDLTDSTVLRNVGAIFGHILIGFKNCYKGLLKLDVNKEKIKQDLYKNAAIITEGLQVVLKKHGIQNSYELVKEFSRNNKKITRENIVEFIVSLKIDISIKKELLLINQDNYIGNANKIKIY